MGKGSRRAGLRLYLIGAGFAARRHAATARKLRIPGGLEIHAAGRRPQRLAALSRQFGATAYADVAAMLAPPPRPTDIVVVATPPHTHEALCLQALQSGRHVLCEKPLALDLAQARRILAAARAAGRHVGCCANRHLGTPVTNRVGALLRKNALGDVYHVTFINRRRRNRAGIDDDPDMKWFLDVAQAGGGVLMDMAPYDFAVLNHVLQPRQVDVESCWMLDPAAPGAPSVLEQQAVAALVFHDRHGRRIHVSYERAAFTQGRPEELAQIEGSRAALRWKWFSLRGQGWLSLSGGQRLLTRRGVPGFGPWDLYERPLVHFHRLVCAGHCPYALVDAAAVFNFACVRALYDCAASGRRQVVRWADFEDRP